MSAYHQMGHDSENLLSAEHLDRFCGAIVSPVNYDEPAIAAQITRFRTERFEIIFDPQLYYPNTDRGRLPSWSYFPTDVDSADRATIGWWKGVLDNLVRVTSELAPSAVCSPVAVPRLYSDEFYALSCEVGSILSRSLADRGVPVLQTVLIRCDDLAGGNRTEEIASIVTRTECDRAYLVFVSEIEPRREYRDVEPLKGVMRLINKLEASGVTVLVGFSSSDVLLWKAAGATSCATGKFFNVRRFTASRFAPPAEGGGQVPYWFEEALVAFLRESDLLRARRAGLLSQPSKENPWGQRILENLDSATPEAWLRLSWRQFLYWFADIEARLNGTPNEADALLTLAENAWDRLAELRILTEERANDGGWLRPWRRALAEFAEVSIA